MLTRTVVSLSEIPVNTCRGCSHNDPVVSRRMMFLRMIMAYGDNGNSVAMKHTRDGESCYSMVLCAH